MPWHAEGDAPSIQEHRIQLLEFRHRPASVASARRLPAAGHHDLRRNSDSLALLWDHRSPLTKPATFI
jgi:hypothetical protein